MEHVELENQYSGFVEAIDWRYSAAICGLLKYLDRYRLEYELTCHGVFYHEEDINEGRYLDLLKNIMATSFIMYF